MSRYIHGWCVFFEFYRAQRRKKHGAGRAGIRQAVFMARCCRWIAAQQHLLHRNPYWKPPMTDPITEAAARAIWKQQQSPGEMSFSWKAYIGEAEAALLAATPLIRAQAFEEAAKWFEETGWLMDEELEVPDAIRALSTPAKPERP